MSIILGSSLNHEVLESIQLPFRLGGLGIRSLTKFYQINYLSSMSAAHRNIIQSFPNFSWHNKLLSIINGIIFNITSLLPDISDDLFFPIKYNRDIIKKLENLTYSKMIDQMSPLNRIRTTQRTIKGASSWLSAPPSPNYLLSPNEYRIAFRYNFGIKINHCNSICNMCGNSIDQLGHHAITCNNGYEKYSRHNSLALFTYKLAIKAGFSPILEQHSATNSISLQRPGDVVIPNWTTGKKLFVDIGITSFSHKIILNNIADNKNKAITNYENQKYVKYNHLFKKDIINTEIFLPIIFDSLGASNQPSLDFFKELARPYIPKL